MFSMMQAAQMLDKAFMFISAETAKRIVSAYVWAVHTEEEVMLFAFDVTRMKAIILMWVARSSFDANAAVSRELDQAS